MAHKIFCIFFLIQLLCFHSDGAVVHVLSDSSKDSRIGRIISEAIREANLPDSTGLSIAFMVDNKIRYKQSSGFSNLEYRAHNHSNSPTSIASLAKQFTAYGIALLIRDGKISLEDTLNKFFPDFPAYASRITIRHMIHHISGIKDQWALMSLAGYSSEDLYSQERVIKMIRSQQELNFEPGAEFLYSNSNYTLLAAIIEKVSGERFGKWMKQHVFDQIGMNNTVFTDISGIIIPNYVQSYFYSTGRFRKQLLNISCVGPSGMVSSLDDLSKWIRHLNLLDSQGSPVAALMKATTNLADGATLSYAFGQGIRRQGDTTLFYHDGSEAGYRSFMGRIPARGIGIIVLANCDGVNTEQLAMTILSRLGQFQTNITKPHKNIAAPTKQIPDSSGKRMADQLIGDYRVNEQIRFKIWNEQQSLKFQVTGKNDVHSIFLVSSDTLIVPALQLKVIPLVDPTGKIDSMEINMKGQSSGLFAVRASKNKLPLLTLYCATYQNSELDVTYMIKELGDRLVVRSNRANEIHLQRVDQDHFIGDQWFFKDVLFQRNTKGNITGFTVSSNRARNNFFKKL